MPRNKLFKSTLKRGSAGASLPEYALVVAAINVVVVGAATILGERSSDSFVTAKNGFTSEEASLDYVGKTGPILNDGVSSSQANSTALPATEDPGNHGGGTSGFPGEYNPFDEPDQQKWGWISSFDGDG